MLAPFFCSDLFIQLCGLVTCSRGNAADMLTQRRAPSLCRVREPGRGKIYRDKTKINDWRDYDPCQKWQKRGLRVMICLV